ncbi:MAG: VOC family protein [Pseudaminobacter sp.]|nr:VOC family protein [Pseudaminobacter sp.]
MKGLNHLVIAAHDLDALCATWAELGFSLTPRGQHPFGTGNAIVQLHGCYLELLSVTIAAEVIEHGARQFSFSAFNRDYLARHEGFSMMVLGTADAAADIAAWRKSGLQTYEPFEFSRLAKMPDSEEVRVGFSLAFVTTPAAPWLGHFACQHYRPEYYAQPHFQRHENTAQRVRDVWISGVGALALANHLSIMIGAPPTVTEPERIVFRTPTGDIVLATPASFEAAFGTPLPHREDGPHLAGLTIGCATLDWFAGGDLMQIGKRLVLEPSRCFGTAVAFST